MVARRTAWWAAVLVVSTASTLLGAVIYTYDHFESGTLEGWMPDGGRHAADECLFNTIWSPPTGEHLGFTRPAEALPLVWNARPTARHMDTGIGEAPSIILDSHDSGMGIKPWYLGNWDYLMAPHRCIDDCKAVSADRPDRWIAGPMVVKIDGVLVSQTPLLATLMLLAAGTVPLLRRRRHLAAAVR